MGGDFDAGSHAAQGKSKFLLDLSCRDLWEVMDRKGGTELTWALPQSLGLCSDLSGEGKFSFMESGIQMARLAYQRICSMMG